MKKKCVVLLRSQRDQFKDKKGKIDFIIAKVLSMMVVQDRKEIN